MPHRGRSGAGGGRDRHVCHTRLFGHPGPRKGQERASTKCVVALDGMRILKLTIEGTPQGQKPVIPSYLKTYHILFHWIHWMNNDEYLNSYTFWQSAINSS